MVRRRRVRRSHNTPAPTLISPPSAMYNAPSAYEMTPLSTLSPQDTGRYAYGENIYDASPERTPNPYYPTDDYASQESPMPSQVASTLEYEPTSLAQELDGLVTPSPYGVAGNEFENNNNDNKYNNNGSSSYNNAYNNNNNNNNNGGDGGYSNAYRSEDFSSRLTSRGPDRPYDNSPRGQGEASWHQNTGRAAEEQQRLSSSNQDAERLSPVTTTKPPFSFETQREERLDTHTGTGSARDHSGRHHSDEYSGLLQVDGTGEGTGPHHHQSSSPHGDGHQRTETTPDTTPPKPAAEAEIQGGGTRTGTRPAPDNGPDRPPTPIFVIPDEVGATGREAEFTPFYGEGSSAQQQQDTTDQSPEERMALDQIRRCAAIRGRPPTAEEIEIIETYYYEMEQRRRAAETRGETETEKADDNTDSDGDDAEDENRRMPNEVSQPSFVYTQEAWDKMGVDKQLDAQARGEPLAQDSGAPPDPGARDDADADADARGSQGRGRGLSFSLHSQLMSSSSEEVGFVDPAVGAEREEGLGGNSFANPDPEGDIAKRVHDLEDWVDEKNFQYAGDKQLLDKTAADVKSLRKTVEQWVAKLGARATSSFGPGSGKGANSEDDIEGAPGAAGLWPLTSGETQTAVAFVALAVFVWLITEAMLHSKRLLDGYGPMFNGGYNGLGSVVVFGTWEKFFFFYGAALYLGQLPLSAIQRAMRRWDERVEGG